MRVLNYVFFRETTIEAAEGTVLSLPETGGLRPARRDDAASMIFGIHDGNQVIYTISGNFSLSIGPLIRCSRPDGPDGEMPLSNVEVGQCLTVSSENDGKLAVATTKGDLVVGYVSKIKDDDLMFDFSPSGKLVFDVDIGEFQILIDPQKERLAQLVLEDGPMEWED